MTSNEMTQKLAKYMQANGSYDTYAIALEFDAPITDEDPYGLNATLGAFFGADDNEQSFEESEELAFAKAYNESLPSKSESKKIIVESPVGFEDMYTSYEVEVEVEETTPPTENIGGGEMLMTEEETAFEAALPMMRETMNWSKGMSASFISIKQWHDAPLESLSDLTSELLEKFISLVQAKAKYSASEMTSEDYLYFDNLQVIKTYRERQANAEREARYTKSIRNRKAAAAAEKAFIDHILAVIDFAPAAPAEDELDFSDIDLLHWYKSDVLPFTQGHETWMSYEETLDIDEAALKRAASLAKAYKIVQSDYHVSASILDKPKSAILSKVVDLGYMRNNDTNKYYAKRGIAKI